MKLDGFPKERIIIDIDSRLPSIKPGRRCDYGIVADEAGTTFFLPVEFKSTNLDFTKVKEQLEGGINSFKEDLGTFICYPVLVSKSLKNQERKQLIKIQISSPYGQKTVKHVLCNKPLKWSEVKEAA